MSRDFKSRDNGDCMVLDFYSDSHQQRPHTSHFFCPGDSTYPPSLHTPPLLHLHPFPTRLLDSPPRVRDFALSKVARLFSLLLLPSGLTCSVNGLGFVVEEMNCVSQLRFFLATVHAVNRVGCRICLSRPLAGYQVAGEGLKFGSIRVDL